MPPFSPSFLLVSKKKKVIEPTSWNSAREKNSLYYRQFRGMLGNLGGEIFVWVGAASLFANLH